MKPWLFLGATEGVVTLAAQTGIVPENLISILVQLPLVAVIIWLQIQNQKWLEHMLEVQRKSLKEIYNGQQVALKEVYNGNQMFLSELLAQIETEQNKMADSIKLLAQQVALFGATLGEMTNVNDVVDRLLAEVRDRGEK